jgi:hypothetical protein
MFTARSRELSVALTVLSAACGAIHTSAAGGWSPSPFGTTSSQCNTSLIAHVKNPTTGTVTVYGMAYLAGGAMPAVLGEVASNAEEDFRLPSDLKEVYFEWASPEEKHGSGELKKVKYKIHCEEKS